MIRINLLTSAARAGVIAPANNIVSGEVNTEEQQAKKQGSLKLFIIFLPALALYLYEFQNIPSLRSDRNRLQATLNELQSYNARAAAAVGEIKKFKEDELRIQQHIAALEKLSADRLAELKVLELFSKVTPEKVWLTRVDITRGRVNIHGRSINSQDHLVFGERLKSSILFSNFEPKKTDQELVDGQQLQTFEFVCQMESNR